jgi:hypothetical protein
MATRSGMVNRGRSNGEVLGDGRSKFEEIYCAHRQLHLVIMHCILGRVKKVGVV